MNGFKFILFSVLFFAVGFLYAQQQPVLPALKDNPSAQILISAAVHDLAAINKVNPSQGISNKIGLYQLALGFLQEPSIIKTTTDYALTSAFLNNQVNLNQINDNEAMMRFYRKQWDQDFIDLVNLVKL